MILCTFYQGEKVIRTCLLPSIPLVNELVTVRDTKGREFRFRVYKREWILPSLAYEPPKANILLAPYE